MHEEKIAVFVGRDCFLLCFGDGFCGAIGQSVGGLAQSSVADCAAELAGGHSDVGGGSAVQVGCGVQF